MGYAHIHTQHLSTRLNVWSQIITSLMASEEHVLPNLGWVSTISVCGSCGCIKLIYSGSNPNTNTKIPEFVEIIQLKDPNGAITMK